MIWESTGLMTVIDAVILAITGLGTWIVWRSRRGLAAANGLRPAVVMIVGLFAIGAFHLADLVVMHVAPALVSRSAAAAAMEAMHLNWTWLVSLVAVACMLVGLTGIVRSEVVLADRLRTTHDELRDSTLRRESAEATLASVEDRMARALRAAGMGTWTYHPATRAVEWTEGVAAIFGVPEERAPTSLEDYVALIHPDDVETVMGSVEAALAKGGSYGVEHRTVTPAGRTRWVSGRGWVYTDSGGQPTMMTGVVWDVTERHLALEAKEEAEQAQIELQRRLSRQQRLESLGTLAGGIAHDFNNLLTPILGHVEMLRDEAEGVDRDRLDQIRMAATRARGLVRQILAFSGNVEPAGGAVDAAVIVAETLELVRSTLPATIEIRPRVDPRSGWVAADPTQLTQVLVNLCTNSAHAMPDGGKLDVDVQGVELRDLATAQGLEPGPYVRITVTDDGRGMSTAVAERAFEPFFTTKEVGMGSGLGLSQVLGIVTTYGGFVTLDSGPGLGTTVQAYLPVVEPEPAEVAAAPSGPPHGVGRILLVDDEQAVTRLLGGMLRSLGYEVTAEVDPRTALERFEAKPEDFDLLVTDQTMPGMTGTALTARVRDVRPGLPTILTSGFTDPAQARESDVVFLMKPFTRAQLAAALDAVSGGVAPRER